MGLEGVMDDILEIQEVYIALHIIFDNIFVKWEEIGWDAKCVERL